MCTYWTFLGQTIGCARYSLRRRHRIYAPMNLPCMRTNAVTAREGGCPQPPRPHVTAALPSRGSSPNAEAAQANDSGTGQRRDGQTPHSNMNTSKNLPNSVSRRMQSVITLRSLPNSRCTLDMKMRYFMWLELTQVNLGKRTRAIVPQFFYIAIFHEILSHQRLHPLAYQETT